MVECLTSNTMAASSLLLVFLLLALRDQLVGSTRSKRAEDLDSHFRRHWLLHMREALLRAGDKKINVLGSCQSGYEVSNAPTCTNVKTLDKTMLTISQGKVKGLSSSPVRNPVKHQLLYCRAGIGFHLQILPDGSVGGVHRPTQHCLLTVFAMRRGVVGIKGVMSGLYLCMDEDGLAFGEEEFSDECLFKENMLENHYTTYSSLSYPGSYLALSNKGRLRRGSTVGPYHISTHFLPRHTM